jgi:hypothetical protein
MSLLTGGVLVQFNPIFHWLGKTGLKVLGLLLQSNGPFDLQMGPRWRVGRVLYPSAFCKNKTTLLSRNVWYSFSVWGTVYASLVCVHEIKSQGISGKHASIYSNCQAALKALQAIRMYFLVHHCQKALNEISARHAVGLYWVCGHAGVRGNEIADGLERRGSGSSF